MKMPTPTVSLERSAWWTFVVALPILSVYGRAFQYWAMDHIGREGIGWVSLLSLALVMTGLALSVRSTRGASAIMLVGAILIGAVYASVPIAEERVHVLLFGMVGYLSMRLHGLWQAAAVCLGLSIGDEVLQAFLPDRVGDIRDVALNAFSSGAGIAMRLVSQRVVRG